MKNTEEHNDNYVSSRIKRAAVALCILAALAIIAFFSDEKRQQFTDAADSASRHTQKLNVTTNASTAHAIPERWTERTGNNNKSNAGRLIVTKRVSPIHGNINKKKPAEIELRNNLLKRNDVVRVERTTEPTNNTTRAAAVKTCNRETNTTGRTCQQCDSLLSAPGDPACSLSMYGRTRCRWWQRQEEIARGMWGSAAANVNGGTYDENLTTATPTVTGLCNTTRDRMNWDGACASVGHRQKAMVSVVVSSKSWLSSELDLGRYDCPASQCVLEEGDGHKSDSHIFLTTVNRRLPDMRKKTKNQINVIFNLESLLNSGKMIPREGIDWLVSHRQDSFPRNRWIPLSYINADEHFFRTKGMGYDKRRSEIPIFIRRCEDNTERGKIISGLGSFVDIESLGTLGDCNLKGVRKVSYESVYPQCADRSRRSAQWDAQKECVFFHSKFALVLENTYEKNYATEKLWQPLKMGAIPIVAGDPKLYRPLLPSPDAAIFLDDFGTYADAAKYITDVSRNESLWARHIAWKEQTFSNSFVCRAKHSFATLACSLCDKYALTSDTQSIHNHLPNIDIVDQCAVDILSRATIPNKLPPIDPAYGIDAVFVAHYTPLKERRATMEQRVKNQFNTNAIFVIDFDRETLSSSDLACLGNRTVQQAFIERVTTKGEDSLTTKHFAVYWYIVSHSLQNVLILEDDAVFFHPDWRNATSLWQAILRDLPADYDMVILSGCCNVHERGEKIADHLYLAQQSRVSSMYLISQKGARNMLRSLPIVAPIDFHINYATGWPDAPLGRHRNNEWMKGLNWVGPRTEDIQVYHSEPPMSNQSDPSGMTGTVRQG